MGILKDSLEIFRSPLHKNAIYLIINTIGLSGFGFVFWLIVVRLFPSDQVGLASGIISSVSLIGLFSSLGFDIGIIRFLPQTVGRKSSDMINTCYTLSGILSIIIGIIFLVGLDLWAPAMLFIRTNPQFSVFYIVFLFLWTLSTLIEAIFISRRATNYILVKNVAIFSVLKLPLPFLLVSFNSFGIFCAWGIAVFVSFLVSISIFLPKIQPQYKFMITVKKNVISPIIHFSFGNYIARILANISPLLLPIMIINMLSSSDAGYFYLSWMIVSLLYIIPTAISTSFLAEASIDEKSFKENLKKSIRFTILLIGIAMFILFVFTEQILSFIGPEYSENATSLTKWLIMSAIPLTINIFYVTIERIKKKVSVIILIYGVISFFTLVLSYLFIPLMGLNGVGVSWLLAQCTALLVVVFQLIKDMRIHIK